MRKAKSSIIGLKVISQSEGRDIGTVRDLIVDQNSDELLALLTSEKDLFGLIDARVIPWDQIVTIGPDAVIVPGEISAELRPNCHDLIPGNYPGVDETKEVFLGGQECQQLI